MLTATCCCTPRGVTQNAQGVVQRVVHKQQKVQTLLIVWLAGLVVWFLLWVQEVPGSNPGTDPKLVAFVPERSKGLDSSSSVFVLVGLSPTECIFYFFLIFLTHVGLCFFSIWNRSRQNSPVAIALCSHAIRSGIVVDSLYGMDIHHPLHGLETNQIQIKINNGDWFIQNTFRLHAHRLTHFPNPKSGEKVAFKSPKPWWHSY